MEVKNFFRVFRANEARNERGAAMQARRFRRCEKAIAFSAGYGESKFASH